MTKEPNKLLQKSVQFSLAQGRIEAGLTTRQIDMQEIIVAQAAEIERLKKSGELATERMHKALDDENRHLQAMIERLKAEKADDASRMLTVQIELVESHAIEINRLRAALLAWQEWDRERFEWLSKDEIAPSLELGTARRLTEEVLK